HGPNPCGSILTLPEKIKKPRRGYKQVGAISISQRKEGSRDQRRRSHEGEIECGSLPKQRNAQRDLPGAAEPEVAPRPRSKNGKQRQQNPSTERTRFGARIVRSKCLCELKKEVKTETGNQRCQDVRWKIVDQEWRFK